MTREQEMYKSIKGLMESYDIVLSIFPAGIPQDTIKAGFNEEPKIARQLLKKYKALDIDKMAS